MDKTVPVDKLIENAIVDWASLRGMLREGSQIDVQLNDIGAPVPYTVLMVLDIPVFMCRAVDGSAIAGFEPGESQMLFIPTMRDFCSVRARIIASAEAGTYLAFTPAGKAEFLKRRRSVRIKTCEEISYRVQFDGKSNIYKGVAVEDIGRGGVGLLVYAAGPVKDEALAKVRINLPRINEQVNADGVVSHCIAHEHMPRMYRIGIQFTRISPRDQQIIAMYIDSTRKASTPRSRI